jgi:hypothetical protein
MRRPLLALAVLGSATLAWSASQRALDLAEMVAAAHEIVIGEVVGTTSRWHRRLIVTEAIVRVDEALKGAPSGRKVKVRQLGGTAVHPVLGAPITMEVSGQARLARGERVLLFLEELRPGRRQLVGAAQGKFVIREERLPVGPKRLRVERDRGTATVGAETMTLERMRGRIGALLGGPTP